MAVKERFLSTAALQMPPSLGNEKMVMKLFEFIEKLQTIHKLVEQQKTGTPEEFAERLGVKRSTLYGIIEELKGKDIPIAYSRQLRSFYYEHPITFSIGYSIESLSQKEMEEKNGGFTNFFIPSINTGRNKPTFAL